MFSLMWYGQQERKVMDERKAEAEKLTREAELFKLQQQLQPHFLFNSLNSISALTGTQPEKARHMIHQLSDFLRGTLRKDEQQWNTLADEIQHKARSTLLTTLSTIACLSSIFISLRITNCNIIHITHHITKNIRMRLSDKIDVAINAV